MNIEDLHQHITSMWPEATEEYWDAYCIDYVETMLDAVAPFHDVTSCVICKEFL